MSEAMDNDIVLEVCMKPLVQCIGRCSRSLRLGQRSSMQRDDHPILVETRPHISRDTAGEVEDAIAADKVGVILDHSLAHTS